MAFGDGLVDNVEKVATIKHTRFKTKVQKPYLI